jgi:hypothetical protein
MQEPAGRLRAEGFEWARVLTFTEPYVRIMWILTTEESPGRRPYIDTAHSEAAA